MQAVIFLQSSTRDISRDSEELKGVLHLACVAWRFWLLSNKGGRGQKNREEIGAGATEKPPARTGGFFESVRMPAYGSF